MCLLFFLKWDFTRRDHPGNPGGGRVSESGPVNYHNAGIRNKLIAICTIFLYVCNMVVLP